MKKYVIWALVALFASFAAYAQTPVNPDKDGQQVGSEVVSNPAASTALASIPATAEWAVISIRNAGIHIRFDASAATTNDLYLASGTLIRTAFVPRSVQPTSLLGQIRMINSTDGAATIYIAYFKRNS